MKKLIQIVVMAVSIACHALPEVVNVRVEPISPWGKAYVTFDLNADLGTNDVAVAVVAHLTASNRQTHVVYEHVSRMTTLDRESNHILWDMKDGRRYFTMSELDFKVKLEEWVQLWENGPYWASCNVGAESPEEAGYSFWWGDTIGYKANEDGQWVASDGSSTNFIFSESTAITYNRTFSDLKSQGVLSGSSETDCRLTRDYDAASIHLGGGCRMPKWSEMSSLSNLCTWTWTAQNGHLGYRVTGKNDYAQRQIFLPVTLVDSATGYYWTSTGGSRYDSIWQYNGGYYQRNYDYTKDASALCIKQSSHSFTFTYLTSLSGIYGSVRYAKCVVRAVLDYKK